MLLSCRCDATCCLGDRLRSIAEHADGRPLAVLWEASRACPERLSSVFDLRASSLRVEHAANRAEAAEVRRRHAALVQVKSCADANLTGLEAHAKRFAPSAVTSRYTRLFRPEAALQREASRFAAQHELAAQCVGLHVGSEVLPKVHKSRRNFTEDLLATAEVRLGSLLRIAPSRIARRGDPPSPFPPKEGEWWTEALKVEAALSPAAASPRVVANRRGGRWWARAATLDGGAAAPSCVFLATDSGAVVERLRRACDAWGVRLVRPPPQASALRGAALELLLLSRCGWLLGTALSSFSAAAARLRWRPAARLELIVPEPHDHWIPRLQYKVVPGSWFQHRAVRLSQALRTPVSYTHLTLPTILLV